MKKMKKMSKIICSILVMCGAFSMSATSVYATGDILIDEPMEMEVVTTVVTSEVIESGELPVISEDKVIEKPKPEIATPETTTPNKDKVLLYTLHDKLKNDKKLGKIAKSSDPQVFVESIFPKSFDTVAQDSYVEQTEAFTSLFENKSKYNAVMAALADMLYKEFNKE